MTSSSTSTGNLDLDVGERRLKHATNVDLVSGGPRKRAYVGGTESNHDLVPAGPGSAELELVRVNVEGGVDVHVQVDVEVNG